MIKNLLNEIISHGDRREIVQYSRFEDLKKDIADLKAIISPLNINGYYEFYGGYQIKAITGVDLVIRS